jgi:hypothetical protein
MLVMALSPPVVEGEAGAPVTVASLPARGRPPAAAARRAGLEFVEKLLTTNLTSTDTTEQAASMLLLVHPRPDPSHRLVELATSDLSLRCLDTSTARLA